MAVNLSDPTEMTGANVTGDQNTKLSKVDNVHLDNQTDKAERALVAPGMFGNHISLVPLAAADFSGGILHLPYTNRAVRGPRRHPPGSATGNGTQRRLPARKEEP